MKGLFLISNFVFAYIIASSQVTVKLVDSVKIDEARHYGWFPSVQALSTGELICDVSLDADEHSLEGVWGYLISTDKGKTWGIRHTAGEFFREAAYTRDPALPDGSMLIISGYPITGPENDFRKLQATSLRFSKGGNSALFERNVTLQFPVPVAKQLIEGVKVKEAAFMVFTGSIIKSKNYGWLMLMYGRFEGDKYYSTVVMKSNNQKAWQYLSTVGGEKEAAEADLKENEKSSEGFCESRMVRLKDGRLFCVMRRGGNNMMYKSWSSDDGKTWSKPTSLGFKGVEPSMILMKNGLLAVCTGRPDPITVRFSRDNGNEWISPFELNSLVSTEKKGTGEKQLKSVSTAYTGMVELDDNNIFIVYDYLPHLEGWGRNPDSDPDAKNIIYGKTLKVDVK